ncbi:MAG: hypothetical protein LBS55_05440 [Prevotellaceae bacterium]|nr:hypothetical protein [Prevotellaceae bacterium]
MNIQFIEHKDITNSILEDICKLKQQHWDYCLEEHKRWVKRNIYEDDIHLVVNQLNTRGGRNNIIGYMNLIRANVVSNVDDAKKMETMWGVGNVCVSQKYLKQEYGFLLMKLAEFYIKQRKKNGILLCKEKFVPFYDSVGWHKYEGNTIIQDKPFNGFVYTKDKISAREIVINRNF